MAFVDELVDALEQQRPERAAGVHVEPARAGGRRARRAAGSSATAPTWSSRRCRSRSVNGGRPATGAPVGVRAALACPDPAGDHERHAARGLGGVASRADGARHRHQRRHSGVRRAHHHGADVVQGSVGGCARPLRAARRSHRARRRPGARGWRACVSDRARTCASPSC